MAQESGTELNGDRPTPRPESYVANAQALLDDFEEQSVEVQHGAIKHAIEALRNARRELPDDY